MGGVGYDPVGGFTVGGRRLMPQSHPALVCMLEAACLCNNAVLGDNASGEDLTSLRSVLLEVKLYTLGSMLHSVLFFVAEVAMTDRLIC